jgi:hypothetical protein
MMQILALSGHLGCETVHVGLGVKVCAPAGIPASSASEHARAPIADNAWNGVKNRERREMTDLNCSLASFSMPLLLGKQITTRKLIRASVVDRGMMRARIQSF